jgi:glutaredoxin-like YruB-family protein
VRRGKGGGVLEVESKEKFDELVSSRRGLMLFAFYTESSEKSREALKVLEDFSGSNKNLEVYKINAGEVRDIHPVYGISSVPSALVFKDGKKINVIHGLQNTEYYESLFVEYVSPQAGEGKKTPRIVVYTSDGCPWCNRAKTYLREQKMPFREVNVSKKPAEADRLVKKTGQTGTPQIDINGHFVVGFDKPKIDGLLGIKSAGG